MQDGTERHDVIRARGPRRSPALTLTAVWFAVVWVAIAAWQSAEHRTTARSHRESLRREGEAGIGMLEAAIRSMGRGRRERPDFLRIVLNEVIAVPIVRGAWLTEPDGTLLASTGEAQVMPAPQDVSQAAWLDMGLIVGRRIDTGPCALGGRGGPPSFVSESRPAHLFLFLDRTELDREIATDFRLRAGIATAAFVALTGAFLFVRARLRSRRLAADLATAEERSRRHREWALLGAGLAHETKNPLAVVRGIAQGLLDRSPAMAEDASKIIEEVDRVVARIGEFLQFSRSAEPQLEDVDASRLLHDMASLIQTDLDHRRGRIAVEAEPISVRADRNMLRQILLNLMVNAVQAIRPGGLITLRASTEPQGTAVLEVTDDGVGIPSDEIDKVLQPYYTRRSGGTGLGLAIVKRLIEAHEWHVTITSQPDAGTTVRITGITRA